VGRGYFIKVYGGKKQKQYGKKKVQIKELARRIRKYLK